MNFNERTWPNRERRLPSTRVVARHCAVMVCLGVMLASCSSYRDDENAQYRQEMLTSILSGSGGPYQPNRVVYLDTPAASPARVLSSRYSRAAPQGPLDDLFHRYILRDGFTVICVADQEEDALYVVLNQKGSYLSVMPYPLNGEISALCRARRRP